MSDYRRDVRDVNSQVGFTSRYVLKWGAIVVLVVFLLFAFAWMLGVFGSVVSTPGRVISRTFETDNVISSYEWYHDAWGTYNARRAQIAQFKQFAADPSNDADEKRRVRTELAAVQQSCRDLVERYNANSRKINRNIFKGQSAPEELEISTCE